MTKEELQKENEEKKEYLRSYQALLKNVKLLQIEIEELRLSKMNPSITYDDMPHSNNNTDLSTYAAILDSKERQLEEVGEQVAARYNEIANKIESMENAVERLVLTFKYLWGSTFDDISDKINYSRRNVIIIHGRALKNFNI